MSEEAMDYPMREDGSINLVALFEFRLNEIPMAETLDTGAVRLAKRLLLNLEARRPVTSRQVAEMAVLVAEQAVVMQMGFATVGDRLGQLNRRTGGR